MEPLYSHLLSKRRLPHLLFSWCQEECTVVQPRAADGAPQAATMAADAAAAAADASTAADAASTEDATNTTDATAATATAATAAAAATDDDGSAGTSADARMGAGALAVPVGKPLILKELESVWSRWPCWDASCTVLIDDDPIK